jgi:ABC-type glycerol-3-phosphate transport system substrate-binding protein
MNSKSFNRRAFLRLAGLAAGSTALAACAPQVIKETQIVTVKETVAPEIVKETVVVENTVKETVKETVVVEATPPPPEVIQITVTDWYGDDASDETKAQMDKIIADFNAIYPNVQIEGHAGGYNPQEYAARLAAGTLENTFAVWFTEHMKFIDAGAVANVTQWLAANDVTADINPAALEASTKEGKRYGLPVGVYAMGLFYNGKLFADAGLDPKTPPKTWEELRAAAKTIREKLGIAGYGETTINNQGGWHLTGWMFTAGANPEKQVDGKWMANFTDPAAVKWLANLKGMAIEDNSLQDEKLLDQGKVGELCGTYQCAMMFGGDPGWFVNDFKAAKEDLYVTIPPQEGGMNGTLGGGYTYMFNSKNTDAQNEAGVNWVAFREFNLDNFENWKKNDAEKGFAVGSPEMPLFVGEFQQKRQAILDKYNNMPQENYAGFYEGLKSIKVMAEPPIKTQEMYAALDVPVQAVVTDPNADPQAVLEEAQAQFQAMLDAG